MARIRTRVRGTRSVIQGLRQMSKDFHEDVKYEIEATLNDIRNDAVVNVPRDTGVLANSIQVLPYEGVVRVNAHYGPYVEFGTGTMVDIPSGLEHYASQFRRGPGHNMPANPYLIPAFQKNAAKLIERLRNAAS